MKYKFVIFSPSYSENNGGAVTLHYLCSLINKNGYKCYLYSGFDNLEINLLNYKKVLPKFFLNLIKQPLRIFKTSNRFITPVLKNFPGNYNNDELIVIYPEIVFGNPLGAKNVVRWLLHNPGFFTNKIYYGSNEIYFKYSDQYNDFYFPNSVTSKKNLFIFTYLKNYYNMNDVSTNRNGVAYCVRKGVISGVPISLKEAILIDGLKHKEISNIFKKVKYFISFDKHTAFSRFAALCGCISIVVPDPNQDVNDWQPDFTKRYGISYGFEEDNIKEALATVDLLRDEVIKEEQESLLNVQEFICEVENFFKSRIQARSATLIN